MEIKKQLAIDEERLRALNEKKQQDTIQEIEEDDLPEDPLLGSFVDEKLTEEEEEDEEDDNAYKDNDDQADEWRRIREELNRKKQEFEANLDPNLSAAEKAALMRQFADQMAEMEREMRKEKEN